MATTLKLDIVSDVVCPWCIIGYKRLQQAVQELGVEDRIDLEWQPFELNPNMPVAGEDIREHVMHKYGSTLEQSKHTEETITELGAELDFQFDYFDSMRIVNTRDAHILLDYAMESGKQTEFKMRLFDAYFNERKDISDRQVLINELEQVGLDGDAAWRRLEDGNARKRVLDSESIWRQHGISSVPSVIFNRSSVLTGAQPIEVYKQALTDFLKLEDDTAGVKHNG